MILVHYKVRIGDRFLRFKPMPGHSNIVPVYEEGNQLFHEGISLENVTNFIALHRSVTTERVIICNVIQSDQDGIHIEMPNRMPNMAVNGNSRIEEIFDEEDEAD